MKKIVLILIVMSLIITSQKEIASAKTFPTARETVDAIGVGWNLGNSLDCNGEWIEKYSANKPEDYEKAWGNPLTTQKMIDAVKAGGFDAIRVPVTWERHMDETGKVDPAWMARVKEIVDYVIKDDLFCIINVHHDAGAEGWLRASKENYDKNSKKFAYLWKQIAEQFISYDEHLLFESVNEMIDESANWSSTSPLGYSAVNDYNQLFVDTVRATKGNNAQRNLVVMGYVASGSRTNLNEFVIPKDTVEEHLLVEVHNYAPMDFTFVEDWNEATRSSIWKESFHQQLAYEIAVLEEFQQKWKLPIIIGEFGASNQDNASERAKYAGDMVKLTAKYGIKTFLWDDGGNMGTFNRHKAAFEYPEIVEAMMKESVARQWGKPGTEQEELVQKDSVTAVKKSIAVKKGKTVRVEFEIEGTSEPKVTSNNKKIARIVRTSAKNGRAVVIVKGVKKGKAKITLKVGAEKKTVRITVTNTKE